MVTDDFHEYCRRGKRRIHITGSDGELMYFVILQYETVRERLGGFECIGDGQIYTGKVNEIPGRGK